MTREIYDFLETELVDKVGPLGKFVLKKQLKDMDMAPDDISRKQLPNLIHNVVKHAVFDEKLQRPIIKDLVQKTKEM